MTSNDLIVDWPVDIPQPPLPDGYEWVVLAQALGMLQSNGRYPWYIRLSWTIKGGKKRMLGMTGEFFATPQDAISCAIKRAKFHAEAQRLKK